MKSEKKSERTLSPEKQGLSKAAQELLSRVRASPSPEVVFGLAPGAAEAKAHSVIDPLIEGTGLPVARLNQYRWYLAELCRLMRTRSGPDLAYCMEYTLKKWLSFGLEPNSVVVLASELFDRLKPLPGPDSSEVRVQKPEFRSTDGGGTSADYTDYADSPARTPEPSNPRTPTEGTADERRWTQIRVPAQGHEEAPDEVRGEKLDARSQKSGLESDDERRTMDDGTMHGGGP